MASGQGVVMDGYGGQNTRNASHYHCHKGPLAKHTFDLKAEVLETLNRIQKVAKVSAEWLPDENRFLYIAKDIEIMNKYGLTMDAAEAAVTLMVYESCRSFEMELPDFN